MKVIALILICLFFITGSMFAQNKTGAKAPVVVIKDTKGKTVSLNQFKGKIVLLNFWATWCPPCRAEIPELIKWQKEYQNKGLQIVGVTYPPTNRIEVLKFVRKNKINYPILFGSKKTKVIFDSGEVMPLSVVFDKEGNVSAIIEGILFQDEFDEKVKPLLATP